MIVMLTFSRLSHITRFLLAVTGLLVALTACTAPGEEKTGGENWVILSKRETAVLQYLGFPGERWTPMEAQVTAVEAALPDYVNNSEPALAEALDSYTRQYAGVTGDEGQQQIYANFFCDPDTWESWQTDFVDVDDGGDCYFQTLYDVDSGTFLWLSVNGES
jgi:hypothetical protein